MTVNVITVDYKDFIELVGLLFSQEVFLEDRNEVLPLNTTVYNQTDRGA